MRGNCAKTPRCGRVALHSRDLVTLRGCDFFDFACSLWLESWEEHLLTSIAGVPSATLRTGSSTARHKPSVMR